MKKQILNSLTTAFFLSLMIFISCGGDGGDGPTPPTAAEEQFARLAKTWTVTSAQADGADVPDWTNLTITFGGTATAGSYNTNGQQPEGTTRVWPSSGTWTFVSETNVNTITRSDNIEIGIAVDTNGTSATLTFEIPSDGGRQDIVEGSWRFQLTAN